jgi:hypothetical protein
LSLDFVLRCEILVGDAFLFVQLGLAGGSKQTSRKLVFLNRHHERGRVTRVGKLGMLVAQDVLAHPEGK